MATTSRIQVFDTTLRDGEQAPGFSMTAAEKLRLAQQLDRLGVDIIEAGFPISSDGDFDAVRAVAGAVRRPTIAGLARAIPGDIDRAWAALSQAARPRIHVFLATSDIHLEHKLRISRAQCLEQVATAVAHARAYCDDVEFSAEDATRSDLEFLCAIAEAAVNAGATTINLPDTVGYALPGDIERIFSTVGRRIGGRAVLSAHCHNDLGLAVANTLAAIDAGVDQAHVTMNGLGERGGNASLEETVMALRTRNDHYRADTSIKSERLVATSRLVSELTGIPVQPNKAVVGANAVAHASGIHQDGVIKDPGTYEIMTPQSVGWQARRIVVSKLSGRRGLAARLAELGVPLEGDALDRAYVLAMKRGDEVHELDERDLIAIAAEARRTPKEPKFAFAPATPAD
jgi:2-isopropylmalate synthase